MNDKYIPPKLTKYGKIENIIQAGSVALQSGDLTGDGIPDQAFDTNGDGRADVIVGGDSGGQTPVNFIQNVVSQSGSLGDYTAGVSVDFYDSDGDGQSDFAIADLNTSPTLQTVDALPNFQDDYFTLSDTGVLYVASIASNLEESSDGGWNDPARD